MKIFICLCCFVSISWATMAQEWKVMQVNPERDVSAMVMGPNNTLYALAVYDITTEEGTHYYVVKYSAEGWTQVGNEWPSFTTPLPSIEDIMIASDGTIYGFWRTSKEARIFRLLPQASAWEQIGYFRFTSQIVSPALALDPHNTPYLSIPPEGTGKLVIQKYVDNQWVVVNGTAATPVQPNVPEGLNYLPEPTVMAIASDGTVYTLVVSCTKPEMATMRDLGPVTLQRLTPAGKWESLGVLPHSFVNFAQHRARFTLNETTGKLYMYGRTSENWDYYSPEYVAAVYDGNTITSVKHGVRETSTSQWFPDGNGAAYLALASSGATHVEKFDGTDWSLVGNSITGNYATGYLSNIFAGNAKYIFTPTTKWEDEVSSTLVHKLQVGETPQQAITFGALDDKTLGDAPFTVPVSASSALNVTLSSVPADRITFDGSEATLVKPGRTTITASQAGDEIWAAAPVAEQSFCINPPKPVLEVELINPDSAVIVSSASSNLWYLDGELIEGETGATLNVETPGTYKAMVKVDDCISDFSQEVTLFVTGIEKENVSVKVFPNPAEDFLSVKGSLSRGSAPEVVDMMGRTRSVQLEETPDGYHIDIRSLDKGIYFLRINDQRALRQIKFVKSMARH